MKTEQQNNNTARRCSIPACFSVLSYYNLYRLDDVYEDVPVIWWQCFVTLIIIFRVSKNRGKLLSYTLRNTTT